MDELELRDFKFMEDAKIFQVGTVHGLLMLEGNAVQIIAIINERPGNGNFKHAMSMIEKMANKQNKSTQVVAIVNEGLRKHLVTKCGYTDHGEYVEKPFSIFSTI